MEFVGFISSVFTFHSIPAEIYWRRYAPIHTCNNYWNLDLKWTLITKESWLQSRIVYNSRLEMKTDLPIHLLHEKCLMSLTILRAISSKGKKLKMRKRKKFIATGCSSQSPRWTKNNLGIDNWADSWKKMKTKNFILGCSSHSARAFKVWWIAKVKQ